MVEHVTDSGPTALGYEVPLGNIEGSLRQLWQANQASTKASLINLVVYSEQEGSLEANSAIVGKITRDHACRALLVDACIDTDRPSSARAWITAHCNLVSGRKSVCSEQIAFELVGKATGRIRNIVFAHLASDLPLVFWWQGQLSRIFEPRLYKLIDRLVVDSAQWPHHELVGSLELLAAARDEMPQAFTLHDLSWTRTAQMRLAFAMLFDPERARAALNAPHRLSIEGNRESWTSMLLLAAWVARALGWRLKSGSPEGCYFENREGIGITVMFVQNDAACCPSVSGMTLECAGGCFETRLESGCRYIRATGDTGEGMSSPHLVPADPAEAPDLLSNLLAKVGSSQPFSQVLPTFIDLARVAVPS